MKRRPPSETKVRVEPAGDPPYPVWVTAAVHPKLTRRGHTRFDPSKLRLWRLPHSKRRQLRTGEWVYRQIRRNDLLERCLGLRDLLQIKRHGIRYYRRHFGKRPVFGWKSVVRDRLGFLYVPYLFEFGDGVEIHWYFLNLPGIVPRSGIPEA